MANVKDITDLIIRQWYEDVVNKRPKLDWVVFSF